MLLNDQAHDLLRAGRAGAKSSKTGIHVVHHFARSHIHTQSDVRMPGRHASFEMIILCSIVTSNRWLAFHPLAEESIDSPVYAGNG